MSWARPGVKCVCVDDEWPAYYLDKGGIYRTPMIGEVLTIVRNRDDGYLIFDEIPEVQGAGRSVAWTVSCFRPLVTRSKEQDMEHFLPLLKTVKEPA